MAGRRDATLRRRWRFAATPACHTIEFGPCCGGESAPRWTTVMSVPDRCQRVDQPQAVRDLPVGGRVGSTPSTHRTRLGAASSRSCGRKAGRPIAGYPPSVRAGRLNTIAREWRGPCFPSVLLPAALCVAQSRLPGLRHKHAFTVHTCRTESASLRAVARCLCTDKARGCNHLLAERRHVRTCEHRQCVCAPKMTQSDTAQLQPHSSEFVTRDTASAVINSPPVQTRPPTVGEAVGFTMLVVRRGTQGAGVVNEAPSTDSSPTAGDR